MGYKIQILGRADLTSDEIHEEMRQAAGNHEVISDLTAKAVAAFWHSPGRVGRVLSQLSHGIEFDTEELLREIELTRPEARSPEDRMELVMLRNWAAHWTGDYRG